MKVIMVLTITGMLSLSAYARNEQNGTTSIPLSDYITTTTGVHTDSLGLATAGAMIYYAVQNFRAKDPVSGLTSAALGVSSALGSFHLVRSVRAADSEVDVIKVIMESEEYQVIRENFGDGLAREFVLDTLAGWSPERLADKYGLDELRDGQEIVINDGPRFRDPNLRLPGPDDGRMPVETGAASR